MKSLAELEQFFEKSGVAWERLDRKRYAALWQKWIDAFGSLFDQDARKNTGAKAGYELSRISTDSFLVLSISDQRRVPYAGKSRGTFAYECCLPETGPIPDLSSFYLLEFVVNPPDFAWTMVHTHEDDGFGGPFFARAEWLHG
jgi:hypothetical protein